MPGTSEETHREIVLAACSVWPGEETEHGVVGEHTVITRAVVAEPAPDAFTSH
jgi:hypothetical protein